MREGWGGGRCGERERERWREGLSGLGEGEERHHHAHDTWGGILTASPFLLNVVVDQ